MQRRTTQSPVFTPFSLCVILMIELFVMFMLLGYDFSAVWLHLWLLLLEQAISAILWAFVPVVATSLILWK